ncbi:ATP-binding cassette domain-containing protein, partial [Klebsiella pneumoniae]|nr:ATP-binding cassette domain-containing protein [Klebsiella pneumoniae]
YLAGRKVIEVPEQRRPVDKDRQLKIVGARENNLDNVSAEIPLGVLVAVTGVSGSGKSTLVNQILAKTLQNQLNGAR